MNNAYPFKTNKNDPKPNAYLKQYLSCLFFRVSKGQHK